MQTTFGAALMLLIALMPGVTLGATVAPVEAYGSLEAVTRVRINPAGTLLSWAANDSNGTQVTVFDIATRRILRNFKVEPGFKVREIDWADDDTLLFAISATLTSTRRNWPSRLELLRWLAADVVSGQTRLLLTEGNKRVLGGSQLVRHRVSGNPALIVMSSRDFAPQNQGTEIGTRLGGKRRDSGYQLNAFSLDIGTGKSKLLESGTPFTTQWVANSHGVPVARADWNPEFSRFTVFSKDGAGWKRLLEVTDDDAVLAGLVDDDSAIAVLTRHGDERRTLWALPLDGSAARRLIDPSGLDAEALISDPLDDAVQGVRFSGTDRPIRWVDAAAEKRYQSLLRTFAGRDCGIVSRSADGKRVVVDVESGSSPGTYYLVDYAARTADIVGEQYPALANVAQGQVKRFTYTARDEYRLFGYLTIPAGAEEKNLPLVVLVHGGPESADTPHFDWWSQFLASRGYAVLRPQFRGSTGLGDAHRLAGRGEWGMRMQDDVTDGCGR